MFENGKLMSCPSVAGKRRKETFDFAQKIHGGSPESQLPAAVGIIDTVLNTCSCSVLVDMLSESNKIKSSCSFSSNL